MSLCTLERSSNRARTPTADRPPPRDPHSATPESPRPARRSYTATEIVVRFASEADVQALMALERAVWEPHQAASAKDIRARLARHPALCIGAFCARSGAALASLFAKPVDRARIHRARSWRECVDDESVGGSRSKALFGISLSSRSAEAARAIFEFFWPHALKGGWREMYLGSPIPGLRAWVEAHPGRPVEEYVYATCRKLPRDPQLRYYFQRGFQRIVAVCPQYFPHAESLDYGVIVGGRIPLAGLSPIWRRLPLPWLQGMKKWLFTLR